jgi:hypothetical protein
VRSLEDLQDALASVDRSHRIQDLKFWHGNIVVSEDFEESTVQRSPQERRVARGDEDEVSMASAKALTEAFDRTAAMTLIVYENSARKYRPNRCLPFRTLDRHNGLAGEGRHRIGDMGDQRATRNLDECLGASESAGLPAREDECGMNGDRMVRLLEKAREGEISRRGFRRIVALRG